MNDRLIIRDGDVDTALVAEYEATRRDAVKKGIALGGGVLAAAAIPTLLMVRNAMAQAGSDEDIVAGAVGLEQTAVVAYATAAKSGLLKGPVEQAATLFGKQEQEHADGLITALEGLGGKAPSPPTPDQVKGLSQVKNQNEILEFAVELETMAVAAYYEAHQRLQDAKLRQTGSSIMYNEGQHLVVLRQALNQNPVPNAFETGES